MVTRFRRSNSLTDLVRRYAELGSDERARVRSMLRNAGYLELMLLQINKDAQAGLESARSEDRSSAAARAPGGVRAPVWDPQIVALGILLAILVAAAIQAILK